MSVEGHGFGALDRSRGLAFLGNFQELQPDLADAGMNQADLPGYAIGYINFASFLVGTSVVDAYKFKLFRAGVNQADDGAKGKVWMRGRQGLAVKLLPVGRLAAIKLCAIPAGIANPSLNRLGGVCFLSEHTWFHPR